jgi:hypothetical protein
MQHLTNEQLLQLLENSKRLLVLCNLSAKQQLEVLFDVEQAQAVLKARGIKCSFGIY